MSQHWSIYRKWNERLFRYAQRAFIGLALYFPIVTNRTILNLLLELARENYEAFRRGRAASNPADSWYKGELGFYDFYIIPLSKKLRDCGVFGPTSDENLNYAVNNRQMWEKQGQKITEDMHKRVEAEYNQQRLPYGTTGEVPPESALDVPCIRELADEEEPEDLMDVRLALHNRAYR